MPARPSSTARLHLGSGSDPEPAIQGRPWIGPPLIYRTLISLALVCLALSACAGNQETNLDGEPMPEKTIQEVQEAYTPDWMKLEGVVGTGIGECDGEPCIRVFLAGPSPEAESVIPSELHGYQIELEVTGPFRPR